MEIHLDTEVKPSIGFLGDVGVSPLELVELARAAEAAGYAGAWMVEYEYDSFAFNQALLQGTERLEVGSCIARYFARDPLLVVENTAVLDLLAPGRYRIGMGTGPMKRSGPEMAQQRWGGDARRSIGRMSEYLEVIRLAMTHPELKFSYDGEFFSFQDVKLRVKPTDHVPIWLSAGGPKMAEVAGRFADGIFVHMVDGERTHKTREIAATAASEAGRDGDKLLMGNLIPTCVSEDGAAARRALRAYLLDYYFHLPHYHKWIDELGFPDAANQLRQIGHQGDTKALSEDILSDPRAAAAAEAIPDALLDRLMIVGTPEECQARLREVAVDWGTDVPILYVFPPDGDWAQGYRDAIAALAPVSSASAATIG
jgi:alkanesulfonate monooxygenase SsuD/methylene tetrahydromethanopterin reductase-like flavin-dependent oxidoreductase (luciferase family)